MPVKLFLSDLDGTLLNQQAQLSPTSLETLRTLLERGLPFSVASARTPFSVLPLLEGLPLRLPWILMNGALIYAPVEAHCPYTCPLTPCEWAALARAERESGVAGLLFTLEEGRVRCHCAPSAPPPLQHYFDRAALRHYPVLWNGFGRRAAWELENTPLLYGMYLDHRPEALARMAEGLGKAGLTLDFYQDIYTSSRWYLEVYSAGASKGAAVNWLRRNCGFSPIVGFGDGYNDQSLFAACEEGYAVSNACPELKRQATGIIGSNVQDGVAVYLKERWKRETDSAGEPLFFKHGLQVPGLSP
ncbi:MAG TPA: Cof-type HAD-IIB family hydrolase [Candidatus Flavonifractor merdigallinarum]|uniref:Cof-type HAD-IIB family hydrolase n=1 Tax=Candidatus Flavonifractor merdigallinarum TaxID=2838589 RepID=A0A9D1YAV9_9FIRM|nr:Cof-type HAD-IIB family hydrolase [Candidatus Flavonifractor merdigallinarum]